MRRQTILITIVLAVFVTGAMPALATFDPVVALDYLRTQQNGDGGFGSGFSPGSSVGFTADVVLAIVAAGGDLATFVKDGNTPLTYLAANTASAVTAGDLAKLILAGTAAGQNPREFGHTDAVAKLEGMLGADGKYGGASETLVGHALAVLALRSVERPIPPTAVAYIASTQQEGGGWAWDATAVTAADTNSTAIAVQALVAGGMPAGSEAVAEALAYYEAIQNEDGGWPYQSPSPYGTATDANSTAVTIQAIIAAGQDPAGAGWTGGSGGTPVTALEALQNPSGAFAWQAAMPDDNLLATVQALPALAGKAFPLATMAVGEATAAAPDTMPATGGMVPGTAIMLTLSGLALAVGGCTLRRRR